MVLIEFSRVENLNLQTDGMLDLEPKQTGADKLAFLIIAPIFVQITCFVPRPRIIVYYEMQ